MIDNFQGVRVMVNDLAVTTERKAVIERCKVVKRRRGWTLSYVTETKPGALRLANGVLVIHPTLYHQLRDYLQAQEVQP